MELIISNDMTITFILQQKDMDKKKKRKWKGNVMEDVICRQYDCGFGLKGRNWIKGNLF